MLHCLHVIIQQYIKIYMTFFISVYSNEIKLMIIQFALFFFILIFFCFVICVCVFSFIVCFYIVYICVAVAMLK